MERIVGYLKGKGKHDELIINKPRSLKTLAYVDVSYVDCAVTRIRSSMGEIQTVGGAIVDAAEAVADVATDAVDAVVDVAE